MAAALAGRRRVYAINPRGIGASGPVRDSRDLTMAAFVDDLVEARKALDVEKWLLCGASTGGMVALLTVLADPDGVSGLILIGTAGSHRFVQGSMYDPNNTEAAQMRQEMQKLMVGGDKEGYREAIFRSSVADPERTPIPAEFSARPDAFSMPRMMAFGQAVSSYDIEDRLGEIRCPTLVLVGRQDPQCPLPNSERLARPGFRGRSCTFSRTVGISRSGNSRRSSRESLTTGCHATETLRPFHASVIAAARRGPSGSVPATRSVTEAKVAKSRVPSIWSSSGAACRLMMEDIRRCPLNSGGRNGR